MALGVDKEAMDKLGASMKKYLDAHMNDKKLWEVQALKNLRQYLGKYDEDVLKLIPEERSRAYPKDTRVKVKGFVAKMMEMMFPGQESNWELSVSPVPSIPQKDLDLIITTLEQREMMVAEQEQREPQAVTSEDIEKAVVAYAEARKDAMEKEIADQLADEDTDYPQLCKRVIRSGGIFGIGVARNPMIRKLEERVWEVDKQTGKYKAVKKTVHRPYPEYVRGWNIYPDLSANTWREQDRIFERMILGRFDFSQLAKRPDFNKEAIREYLKDNQSGNYIERGFETDLKTLANTANLTDKAKRRYEVFRHLGFVSGHDLAAVGVDVSEDKLSDELLADIWFIDDVIIKAELAAFGERPADQYPAFIPAEDEDSGLLGVGLPEDLRDSQLCICAATRALMDNMAVSAGPILEVNMDLLPSGRKQVGDIHAFQTIYREGEGQDSQYPAVREIKVDSHVGDILPIIDMHRKQLDTESNLPAWLFGDSQNLGEAFRTSNNMSMMSGGANMVSKDVARAFDVFTTQLIGGTLKWNMEFNDREDIKGDFSVRPKGVLSLVAKEIRGAALDQFMSTITEEERAMLDTYGVMLDRLKSRDLPTDRLLSREDATKKISEMQQAAQQAQHAEQGLTQAKTQKTAAEANNIQQTTDATIQELMSRVEERLGKAKTEIDRTQLENLKLLLSAAEETPQASKEPGV